MCLWVGWAGPSWDSSPFCSMWCWPASVMELPLGRKPPWFHNPVCPSAKMALFFVFILKDFLPFMTIHLLWPFLPCGLTNMIAQTACKFILHKREKDSALLKSLVRELEKHHIYPILLVKASNKVSSDWKCKGRVQGHEYKKIVFGGHIITIYRTY